MKVTWDDETQYMEIHQNSMGPVTTNQYIAACFLGIESSYPNGTG